MNNFFITLGEIDIIPDFDTCVLSEDALTPRVDNEQRSYDKDQTQFIYRELTAKYLLPHITDYVEKSKLQIIEKSNERRKTYLEQTGVRVKDVPMSSLHIGSDGASVDAMAEFVKAAEVETSSTINWICTATHGDETKFERIRHLKEKFWMRNITAAMCSIENERKTRNYLRNKKQNISFITVCKSDPLPGVVMAINLLTVEGSLVMEMTSQSPSAILILCALFSRVELVCIHGRKFVVAMQLKYKINLPYNLSEEKLLVQFSTAENYHHILNSVRV